MNKLDDFCKKLKLKLKHTSFVHLQFNPFWLQLSYFITLSLLGFLALDTLKTKTSTTPEKLDLFFTSVSAVTVSSMSTVEMEVFSNPQLVVLTILMFVGGEVFNSMLGLHLMRAKKSLTCTQSWDSQIELGTMDRIEREEGAMEERDGGSMELKCIKALAYLVSCYLLVTHTVGSTLISIYLSLIPSAGEVLKSKHISLQTFSVFTTVSTFANCGFVPTNENMMVFRENSGLLLILVPQLLIGNTLYPVFLRLLIWFVEKVTKKAEFRYMLRNPREVGYDHLLSGLQCLYLGITVFGFVVLQLVVFCSLEWTSQAVNGVGLNGYQKAVGSLFQVINSRHAGESVFDLSAISPAILVLFVFMMYLPPYTSYLPIEKAENISASDEGGKGTRKNKGFLEAIRFSQLTYLLIFVILICITEKQKMKNDPLNFNVLNIVFEVISAYGNVGLTLGYSCERQMKGDGQCKDAWSGFVGRWSNAGKFVLIVVMLFGRLKKFSMGGGRAWILA